MSQRDAGPRDRGFGNASTEPVKAEAIQHIIRLSLHILSESAIISILEIHAEFLKFIEYSNTRNRVYSYTVLTTYNDFILSMYLPLILTIVTHSNNPTIVNPLLHHPPSHVT